MGMQPYLIAPFQAGLQTGVKPWLIPEDAFERLENAHVWRGRVQKKHGYQSFGSTHLTSRLRIRVGTTNSSGPTIISLSGKEISEGQIFSVEDQIFTVGTPPSKSSQNPLLSTGSGTASLIWQSSRFNLNLSSFNSRKPVFWFPSTEITSIVQRVQVGADQKQTIVFDKHYSYKKTSSGWGQLSTKKWSDTTLNHLSFAHFFGSEIYQTFFYAVDGNEVIRYLPEDSDSWSDLKPKLSISSDRYLHTAEVLRTFGNRLVCFNTKEGTQTTSLPKQYKARIRWSPIGVLTPNWFDDQLGVGGYLEIPTGEAIVAAEIFKGKCFVFCDNSTWELIYQPSALPSSSSQPQKDNSLLFAIRQVNSEFGAISKNSFTPLDKALVGISPKGIVGCDGMNIERIDENVPEEFLSINDTQYKKVFSYRDFHSKLIGWIFPSNRSAHSNTVLMWNYDNDTWSLFKDSITCVGQYDEQTSFSWARAGELYDSWAAWIAPWDAPYEQEKSERLIAGNQEGFLMIQDKEKASNAEELLVHNVSTQNQTLKSINHNIESEYVYCEHFEGLTGINKKVAKGTKVDDNTLKIDIGFTGSYRGGGTLTRIPQMNILTKQWNFTTRGATQFRVPYVDFLMGATQNGGFSVDYYLDSSRSTTTGSSMLGSNAISTEIQNKERDWIRFFPQSVQTALQFRLFLSDAQMKDPKISMKSGFMLHALMFYISQEGRLTK